MTQREVNRIMKEATRLFVSGGVEESNKMVSDLLDRLKKENWKNKKVERDAG